MTISMKKQYRTRDGQPVRILCTNRDSRYTVVGMIGSELMVWQSNGMYDHSEHRYDLIEVTIYDDFKIDDKVIVGNSPNGQQVRRYFAGISPNGNPLAFRYGRTSWTSAGVVDEWKECRKPTEEELCSDYHKE